MNDVYDGCNSKQLIQVLSRFSKETQEVPQETKAETEPEDGLILAVTTSRVETFGDHQDRHFPRGIVQDAPVKKAVSPTCQADHRCSI